jgi:hypothetical protein
VLHAEARQLLLLSSGDAAHVRAPASRRSATRRVCRVGGVLVGACALGDCVGRQRCARGGAAAAAALEGAATRRTCVRPRLGARRRGVCAASVVLLVGACALGESVGRQLRARGDRAARLLHGIWAAQRSVLGCAAARRRGR